MPYAAVTRWRPMLMAQWLCQGIDDRSGTFGVDMALLTGRDSDGKATGQY